MPTLIDAFARTLARRRDAAAVLFEGAQYSFAQIEQKADAVGALLGSAGIAPGDRVAVGLANSPDLVACVLGVIRAGAVLVPLNPAYTADEVVYAVADAGARLAVVEPVHAEMLAAAGPPGLLLHAGAIPPIGQRAAPAQVDPEATALIVYTSGTTGRPKGVMLSHRALLSNLTTIAGIWQWTERDRLLLSLPCFHLHGLGLGIIAGFIVGSSIALRRRFVAEEIPGDLDRCGATMFFGVPTMYNRLVTLPDEALRGADLSRMRLWVSGSAPLSAATFDRFRERFGADLLERYGMTECCFALSGRCDATRRPGLVGFPVPGVEVRIVDPDAAAAGRLIDVEDGAAGEIIVRGPNLFSGYWGRPEETARVFAGGFMLTGDLAVREGDGMFRIVGRSSVDIIKTRGFKVGAVEIENCLQRHPAIQEVAVVGVPDADQGESVVAAVTLVPGARSTPDDIRDYARRFLAPHKVPKRIELLADIPRTGPGKFKKKELIRLLAKG
jgi:acyl-CoA synthetase (AMP-forming)/AMP-acid ligase II